MNDDDGGALAAHIARRRAAVQAERIGQGLPPLVTDAETLAVIARAITAAGTDELERVATGEAVS